MKIQPKSSIKNNLLPNSEIVTKIPADVFTLMFKFIKSGFEIYIVGGAVRDLITGKPLYDWDFTTNATPDEMLKMLPNAYYDNLFGMVGVPVENGRSYEITTFRTERGYSDLRRPDVVEWGISLEEDLARRDFTINAMVLKITDSSSIDFDNLEDVKKIRLELIDIFHGQKDLDKRVVRAVGNPHERFSEDALRMMRAVRIAAEINFQIEKTTLDAIKANAALIHKIAKERIKDELLKLLASPHPYVGMLLLKESGLLQEVLPELEKTFGVEQKSPGRHHIYDVGTHSLMALKYCPSTDPIVRFACLIHDIGKPLTYRKLENGTITFYNHEIVSTKIAARITERLRFSNKQSEKIEKLVRWHQFTVDERQTDAAIRRFIRNIGIENVSDILDLRVGDRLGGGARETSWRLEEFKKRLVEVQKQPFAVKDLKITGNDVMQELNLKPGPKVGEILNRLFEEVVEQKVENKREYLLERLKQLKTC